MSLQGTLNFGHGFDEPLHFGQNRFLTPIQIDITIIMNWRKMCIRDRDKIRCLTQQRDYARTHQKIVEIPVEKPVLYEKCEACDRTDYQNAKAKYETQKERLAGQYKAKTDVYKRQVYSIQGTSSSNHGRYGQRNL